MSNYNLFSRFEDALIHFHTTLKQTSEHYVSLFKKMLDGEDIHKDLIEDVYFFAIQQTRYILKEEQGRISRVLGDSDSYFTLSEIQARANDKFSTDIVMMGKSCISYYSEIERYIHAIEEYFGAKVNDYRSFFEKIYRSEPDSHLYDNNGKVSHKKQGVLIRTNA